MPAKNLEYKEIKKLLSPKTTFYASLLIIILLTFGGFFYLFKEVYLETTLSLGELENSLSSVHVINIEPIKSSKFEKEITENLNKGLNCR